MDRTVDVSGLPTFLFQCLLAASLVLGGLVVGGAVLAWLLGALGVPVGPLSGVPVVVAVAVLWPVSTVLWVRHLRRADGEWWGPVPSEQYLGRFAGYGGLARHDWERALDQLPDDERED